MITVPRWVRVLLLALVACLLAIPVLSACGSDNAVNNAADESTIRPDPITTASGQQCTPWVNNPGEADGSGYRACDYPIPQDRPVRSQGMSDADWFLMGALWGTAMGHPGYYYSDDYYRYHIGPAWNRHPGYSGYGWGHRPITRVDARTYNTTIVHVNKTYAADEKKATADPKTSGYHSASGKAYNGKTVPKTAFKGSNVPVTGPAGNARNSNTPSAPSTKTAPAPSKGSNTSPGTGYSKGSSNSSSSSGRSSSSSSSSSSSGRSSSSSSSSSSSRSGR